MVQKSSNNDVFSGHKFGGLDRRDVFCTGRTFILELALFRSTHCGK